jgi:PIN domain nuclease of toxin-antitoxin system
MRVLINTHVLIWWTGETNQLSPLVQDMLADQQIEPVLSMASIWEMQIKISLGKLSLQMDLPTLVETEMSRNRFTLLPIELKHIYKLDDLPLHHKDPFDRLLIAQSMLEKMPIISIDEKFDAYGVQRLW